MTSTASEKSWFAKILGRSFISVLFGNFFESKNNTAALIGISVVATLCYVIVAEQKHEYVSPLLNIVFVVIGYYFGAKATPSEDKDE